MIRKFVTINNEPTIHQQFTHNSPRIHQQFNEPSTLIHSQMSGTSPPGAGRHIPSRSTSDRGRCIEKAVKNMYHLQRMFYKYYKYVNIYNVHMVYIYMLKYYPHLFSIKTHVSHQKVTKGAGRTKITPPWVFWAASEP